MSDEELKRYKDALRDNKIQRQKIRELERENRALNRCLSAITLFTFISAFLFYAVR